MSLRPMPPHLCRQKARGKTVWYIRKGKGSRTRIRGEFGSEEFAKNYQAAVFGQEPQGRPQAANGTLAWLIDTYQDSAGWAALSEATKKQRNHHYGTALKRAGDARLSEITAKTIQIAVEDRARTPFSANDFLKAMRGLFGWAKRQGHIEIDPTDGVKGYPIKTEGHHTWTDEEIVRFEMKWPVGTRERLALAILLYTGLRRGDMAILGHQNIRNNVITFRTTKTGHQVTIPLLPELARIIDATKTGDLALIATADGRPMTKESFGKWFSQAARAAGVPGTAHGLRKAGATRAAEHGFTEAELEAWFGWHGGRMASLYTRKVDRAKLAKEAARKLK